VRTRPCRSATSTSTSDSTDTRTNDKQAPWQLAEKFRSGMPRPRAMAACRKDSSLTERNKSNICEIGALVSARVLVLVLILVEVLLKLMINSSHGSLPKRFVID